jgi:peptidoglycan/LPS O-acetylase OafA/YrhL
MELFNGLKVISMLIIIAGNTHYYVLSGPLRNIEVIHQWFNTLGFGFAINADLHVDVFFWITGFVLAFNTLKHIQKNDGVMLAHPARIILDRYLRLLPLYLFMIFLLWQFMAMFGGDGPRFFQYE